MQHLSILKLAIIVLASTFTLAHGEESLETYTQTSKALLEHLGESIPVLDLSSGPAKTEQDALNNRLESLQNKRVSNREWHEFWQEQAILSQTLVTNLEGLSPERLERTKRTLNETLKKLQAETMTPKLIVNQRIATLRSEIKVLVDENTRVDARLDTIRTTLKKLGQTAAKLSPTPAPSDSKVKNPALEKAIQDTENKIERLTQSYQTNEARLLTKEGRLETLTIDPTSLSNEDLGDDAALKQALESMREMVNDQSKGANL
jgi:chromosome segregation ATPase